MLRSQLILSNLKAPEIGTCKLCRKTAVDMFQNKFGADIGKIYLFDLKKHTPKKTDMSPKKGLFQ